MTYSTHEYNNIYRISEDGVELKMTRKIIKDNDKIYLNHSVYMSYDWTNTINSDVNFDFVQNFYVINGNFIVCPKGPYHPYNLGTGKYEIPKDVEAKNINNWDLKCFKVDSNYLIVFYFINGDKNFFYRSLNNNDESGSLLNQDDELYDYKINNKKYHDDKNGNYEMIGLIKRNEKLALKGKLFYFEEEKKDQYDADC